MHDLSSRIWTFRWAVLSLLFSVVLSRPGWAESVVDVSTEHSVSEHFLNFRWSESDRLLGGSILDLAQSPDGLLWVSTRFGLRALDGARFFVSEGLESLSDEPVQRVLFDANGQIWLRGQGSVYCLKHQPRGGYQTEQLSASDVVKDGKGWVWWQNGRVIRGRFRSLEVELPPRPVSEGESLEMVPTLCGAREGGVYQVDDWGNLWVAFFIQSIALDSGGRLWAASGAHGLFVRDGNCLSTPAQVPAVLQGGTCINALAASPRGLVLGGDGLLMLIDDAGRVVSGHDHSRMPGAASVESLAVDSSGGIWAGTDSGLGGVSKNSHKKTSIGIPGVGDSLVSLRRNLAARLQPPLVRYSVSDDNHSWTHVGLADSFRIAQPLKQRFPLRIQTKLPGGAWRTGPIPEVEVDRSPSIPAPWRAGILVSFLVLLALVARQSYQICRNRRSAYIRALEGILSERVRISRSLHDDLGNRLSEIQLLAEQMICSQESQERVDPMLNRIHQRTLDATEALDSLVWLLRDVSESSIDFGRHVEWLARNYLSTCNVGLDFKILAGQDIEIGGRVRQLLIMANQELIRNVARHGRATQIVIQLRISADWVYYQIEDNGCGFSVQSALALGRGLSNFVNQVEGVGGWVTVASQPGRSVIAVKMPRVLP